MNKKENNETLDETLENVDNTGAENTESAETAETQKPLTQEEQMQKELDEANDIHPTMQQVRQPATTCF